MRVKKIYRSFYEEKLDFDTIGIKGGNIIKIDDIYFEVLSPLKDYGDSNQNSIVLYFSIDGYSFLCTGDIDVSVEEELVHIYKEKLKSYVLKVGHHGSKTSSSDMFINMVKPYVSVLSVGENNRYGLPNDFVLDRLCKISKVYNTSKNGNIYFKIRNKKIEIFSYRNNSN